jgi:DNA-binding transcriptional ArsR family regulator
METADAVTALSALAQETRLEVFRALVRAGPTGLAAGEIATSLGVAPSTLSFHLAHLERAGLLRSTRQQRSIVYTADFDGTRALLTFLTEDCCNGHPEICGDLGRAASCSPKKSTRKAKEATR